MKFVRGETGAMKSSMNGIDRPDAVDGPVVSEGGRSPSTLPTGQGVAAAGGGTPSGPLAPGQRWSAARKREVVLRLMRGESAELLSRELGVPVFRLERWRQKAEAALEDALKEREADPADGQLAAAMQRIGELSMEVELLRARIARPGPLARGRSR
jgi:transposase